MFSKTKRRIMSAFIAASMAMTPLLGYADIIRGDGGTVDNIWAVPGAEGPDISTLTISDDQPGEGYILFGKYIDDYVNYEITSEDEGLMILANNSSLETPPGLNVDYRLSGECYVTVTGLMVAFTDDRFPEYEGDKSVPSLLEFYTSDTYEDDEANNQWAERLNIEVFGEMDITDWFAANDLIIDEGAVFNIGYYDEENDEWHDGHVTAGNVIIGGELHIGDKNEDGPESELIIFDDLSIQSTGKLTAACNACLVFGDMATCSAEGFPLKIRNEQGELVDFEFEDGHGRYEFVSRPVDEQDPETDIYWEYRDVGPERGENTYCVDYDDRGGEASVTVGEGEEETVLHPWDQYEFEPGTAVEFKLNPPEGYDFSTVIVEIVEFAENEDVNYSSAFETTDEHYIAIDRTNGTFEFTTDCYGYDVYIFWSPFDFRFDHDNEFVIETHSNDKGSIVLVDDSACELVEEDPYNPGNFRYLFSNEVLDDGNTLQVTFVPKTNCILQDFGININQTETFYGREERPDHLTIVFDEAENLVYNGDGTYTWTISGSGWREWYNINAYFEKIVNVNGIEIEARDATTIEYKLDDGSYNPLPLTTIGVEEGAREGYLISPETLDGHDSITFRFTYENGVIKEGVRVEYAQGTNLVVDILPFDNDSNPYEFTLSKTGTDWNDYHIQVNDWPTPFNGTYLVTKHGPGDVTVTGVATDVLTAYEDGQTLTFTATCDEGIYKVVGRYSNDPNNGEFDIPCNEGTYTIQPNGGGLDIMIYTTQEEYNIDHLNANYGEGEFDFEIFMNDHGFHENNAQFDGEFTFVEDEEHIKAFAASGNRTRFVVTFTDTELQTGKAKITLNLIPKYDCVYEVYVGGNKLDIENDQVEIDLSNVISGAHDPINIEVTYEAPKTLSLIETEHVTVSYSLDGETYTAFPEENIIDLKRFPDIYEIYIKTEAEEGYVCDSIDIYVNGECIESRSETRGIYWFDVSDEWVSCEIRPQVNRTGGNYTVKYAREEDSSELIFNGITANSPASYYTGDEIVIDTLIGDVYKAYAITDGLDPIELTNDGRIYRFTPPQNGDYDIIFYISYDEYVFETLKGDNVAMINVEGLTEEAGSITCGNSAGSAVYKGVMKFVCPEDTTEITIQVNEGYDYTVVNDQQEDITASVKNNGNKMSLTCNTGSWPTVTFEEIPALIAGSSDKEFTNNPGTEITMTADIQDTGAVVASREWFQSANGEDYTKIDGATGETYTASPVSTTYYKCVVTDSYGKTLDIIFVANVTLIPLVDMTPNSSKSFTVEAFDTVTLTALVNDDEVTVTNYSWYMSIDDWETSGEVTGDGNSITKEMMYGTNWYKCIVTDSYGQTVEIEFEVKAIVPDLVDTRTDEEKNIAVDYDGTTMLVLEAKTNGKEKFGFKYSWLISTDGNTYTPTGTSTNSKTYSFIPNESLKVRCVVTNLFKQSLTLDYDITVNFVLDELTPDSSKTITIAKGDDAILTPVIDSSHTTGVLYSWSCSTDDSYTSNEASITVTPDASTSYTCTITDAHGNTCEVTFTITVIPELLDSREDSEKAFEVEYTDSVTLEAKTNAIEPHYVWYEFSNEGNTMEIPGASGDTFTFTPSSGKVIRCTVTDKFGNSIDLDFDVTVRFVLTDNTQAEDKNIEIVMFESATLAPDIDSSKTTGVTYAWSYLEDGTEFTDLPDTESSITVAPESFTTYKCTVSDEHGNTLSVIFTVNVTVPELNDTRDESDKTITVTYDGTTEITLDAKTDGTDEYQLRYTWSESSDGENFTPIVGASSKTFSFIPSDSTTIRCTVTDIYGHGLELDFLIDVSFILTDNTPESDKNVTTLKSVSITLEPDIDASRTSGVTYAWYESTDGTTYSDYPTATSSSIEPAPEETTYYKCIVSDTHGNSATVIYKVNVVENEMKDERTDSEKAVEVECTDSVTLVAKTDAVEGNYTWSESSDGTNFTPITGASGDTFTYTPNASEVIRCQVTDKFGRSITLNFDVTVNYVLTDNTTASAKSVTIIKTESTTLAPVIDDSKTTGVSYSWSSSTDSSFTSSAASITVTPNATTTYTCTVSDTHGNSCVVTFTVTVNVPKITDKRSASEKSCKVTYPNSVTLNANTDAIGPSYTWSESLDGTNFTPITGASGKTFSFKPTADETVRCKVTDKYGTTKVLDFKVTVTYKLTDKTASSAKSVTITKFDSTKLEVKVSEDTTTGIKYTWYSSTDGKTFTKMSDTAKSVTVKPTETTTYKCEVKDAHGNSINVIFKVNVKVPVLKDLTSASAKTVTADKDSDVTLEVKVNDTETTGIKYKWYKSTNGTSFNVVAGEKTSKITFKADADVTYSCTVTDKYGNSIEVVFKVTVTEPVDPDSESFGGFVERLYNVALGRESEAEGKEFWVKNVEAGNLTGADAAREFLNSKEFKDKGLNDEQFLAVLYKTFFNRDYKDDPDGFNFWMNSLKSVGRDKVVDGFINSTEWCNICAEYGIRSGATTAKATIASKNAIAFAERLYTCCLGREAEPDGLKFWSLSLTNLEVSGSEAARQFFTSAEFKGFNTSNEEYIKRLYTTFMGREYDEGGLNYWLGEMKNGMSREQVFDNFASSKEFTDICNSYGIQR